MTTGSLCLTEILMSRKPCSSNSEHSQSADSTSASGVALPYFSSNRLSSEPALTPMRIGTPAALAARAISPTLSSKALMLPGFTRTAAQPASIAAKTYLGWKWMSAITGICDFLAIAGSASASSWVGHATRTIWQPDAVSSAICWSVASMLFVGVVVIDCTDTGASPPTSTPPTSIWRDTRRCARGRGGVSGMPRLMLMGPFSLTPSNRAAKALPRTFVDSCTPDTPQNRCVAVHKGESPRSGLLADADRVDDVGGQGEQGQPAEGQDDEIGQRQQLVVVDPPRVGLAATGRYPRPDSLVPRDRDVTRRRAAAAGTG